MIAPALAGAHESAFLFKKHEHAGQPCAIHSFVEHQSSGAAAATPALTAAPMGEAVEPASLARLFSAWNYNASRPRSPPPSVPI